MTRKPPAGPLEAVSGGTQEGLEASAAPPRSPDESQPDRWAADIRASLAEASAKQAAGYGDGLVPVYVSSMEALRLLREIVTPQEWSRIDLFGPVGNAPQAPPSPDSPSQGERKQQLLDQDRAPSARSVLTELLRLYDWRFVLAEREKNPINDTGPVFRAETKRLLRQYGTEKKAAWEAARLVLASDKPPARPPSPSSASLESGGGTLDTMGAATLARSDSEER